MMRMGAPFANVPTAADTPEAVAMSMLPPMSAWIDWPGLNVKDIQVQPVLLEDPASLAEVGHPGIPGAALRDRNFEGVFRPGSVARCDHRDDRENGHEFR